jgi:hypothetical protein
VYNGPHNLAGKEYMMTVDIKTFLKTAFQNIRSSKRTDVLHEAVLNQLIQNYPDYDKYEWRFEERIKKDGYGGTFDIDIIGFLKGKAKIAILCKCINSNYGKNSKNYANTTIGEAYRLVYAEDVKIEKAIFVNIYPTICPSFDKSGKVNHYDNIEKYKSRTNVGQALFNLYGKKVEEVNVSYDIENISNKKSKKDFDVINPINISEFKLKYAK